MTTKNKAKLIKNEKNSDDDNNDNSDLLKVVEMNDNNNVEIIPKQKKKILIQTKPTQMNTLLKKLNIDETFTQKPKKDKFDKIKENTFPVGGYNYMSDLLELPQTKQGFKYLLVVVDLWNNNFDIEPIQSKSASDTLEAFKTIIKRQYTKLPKASVRTDNGNEFKGSFKAFLNDNNILHRVALPYRHKQLANVESLNAILGRLFMTYLTNKELQIKKPYHEWTDIVGIVRKELNDARYSPDDENPFNTKPIPYNIDEPKFKKGDIVYKKLEVPKNIYGKVEADRKFRKGDLRFDPDEKLKITKVLNYPRNNRYVLNTYPNVSYSENELKPADKNEEYFLVKEIIDKKKIRGKTFYLVWFKRELKKNSSWISEENLLQDGLEDYIDDYNDKMRRK
jgi:hypothetical protein